MNNSLNLASKPFSNRILPWALTAIILFVSLIGLILVVRLTTTAKREADQRPSRNQRVEATGTGSARSSQDVQSSFTPDQQQALPAAHQLVDRKSFSWSRLLADLETSLPNNVKSFANLRAGCDQSRRIKLSPNSILPFLHKNPSTINEMIATMHQEGIFQLELRNQNLQKGRGEAGTEYEFAVIYRARPGYSIESVAEVDDAGKQARFEDESRSESRISISEARGSQV